MRIWIQDVVDWFEVRAHTSLTRIADVQMVCGLCYSGGKSAAATIETDAEYELLRTQLLASKKNANAITVFISFDTDEMDAFRRLRKRVSTWIGYVYMMAINKLIAYRWTLTIIWKVVLYWVLR